MSLSCNRIIIFPWLKVVFLFLNHFCFWGLVVLVANHKNQHKFCRHVFYISAERKPHVKNYFGFFWLRDSGRGFIRCMAGIGDARSDLIERDCLTDVFLWCCISQAPTRLLSQPSSRIAPSPRGSASKKPTNSRWGRSELHPIRHLLSTRPSLLSVSSCKAGFPSCWALTD